jgi:hypothetical protein
LDCPLPGVPRHFPHWDNVYKTFRRWSAQGKFEQMHDRLRTMWRQREAREVQAGAAILEAQSTRISPQGGQSGFDAGKKVKGRKRHIEPTHDMKVQVVRHSGNRNVGQWHTPQMAFFPAEWLPIKEWRRVAPKATFLDSKPSRE